ncbi:MAG TPA: MFS transporter [Acidobacteriaceae bacterium]|jgi:MFS family permease
MQRTLKFNGWYLLGVVFALDFINMGFPYFGAPVINSYMIERIPMSRSTLGLGFTLVNLVVGLTAPLVAMHIVKFGVRRTLVSGCTLIACSSLFLATLASKPWHYLAAFGIVTGIGVGFATIVPIATFVTRWFRRYRGRAMGIALSGSGFSGFAVSGLLDKVMHSAHGNWRIGWLVVCAAIMLSGVLAFFLIKESPESLGQHVDGDQDDSATSAAEQSAQGPWTVSQAYRTSSFWLIAFAGIVHTYTYFFFVAHAILYLKGSGISSGKAALAMGFFTTSTLIGRWIGGLLMDFLSARLAYSLGLSLVIFGSYYLLIANRPDALIPAYAAAILYGCAHGWVFTCVATMTGNYYGRRNFPKLYGTMMLLISACASPAGYLGGKVYDLLGSYRPAIIANVILSVVSIVAILFAAAPAQPGPVLSTANGALEERSL